MASAPYGVTVAVCTHNGAARIAAVLDHLAGQRDTESIPWEVLVVDNASSDATADAARRAWNGTIAPLRIVSERRLGLSYARWRALEEAAFELVAFIDDDNWVSDTWIRQVADLMADNPQAAVLGGRVVGVFEVPPPPWLAEFYEDLAIGAQACSGGDITERGYVWGAGMTVRRAACLELRDAGFHQQLRDRRGSDLSSGGDVELCLALRRRRWRILYDERLVLRHFIPRSRMNAAYIRRLRRGHGASTVVLQKAGVSTVQPPLRPRWLRMSRAWPYVSAVVAVGRLWPALLARRTATPAEKLLRFEFALGRLLALLGVRAP